MHCIKPLSPMQSPGPPVLRRPDAQPGIFGRPGPRVSSTPSQASADHLDPSMTRHPAAWVGSYDFPAARPDAYSLTAEWCCFVVLRSVRLKRLCRISNA
ncbi:hypothetical protein N657DRAFT_641321 [Parathielavia appendiculata]|uniref:Uncharacterized protein n=1 Tax=Parathielavia appendiculata TaxID=2587402 RepID=A0AAN6U7K9_9PEZI|nr:hypothetical protein N657DRAFT_641321 [Parathielavia appendiculata]